MGDEDMSDGSDTETERPWFPEPRTNGASLAEPIGTVARSGQLGAPLGIAHLALGAVTAAMSAYNPGRTGRGEGDGLPRVRMLSCLHALFTQLHDPDQADDASGIEENGRPGSGNSVRSQLDSSELDVLEKAVRILHLRYRSCLRPLTKGRLPSLTELRELRVSAEALGVRAAVLCLDRIPKGDPRRLPLFAFRTFALRAELDAEALRALEEPPAGKEWAVPCYRVHTSRLRDLLEDMVEEIQALWNATNRTLFEVAIALAPVLAQYALLGKAVAMAVEHYCARLTVRKHGRVVLAVGDEIILWDDGLEDIRELFLGEKSPDEPPLGPTVRIDSMNDYSWFVAWNGTSAVDSIPSEVSVKRLLHSLGAPTSRLASLRQRDKALLMAATQPDVRIEAERRIVQQLQWAVDGGAKLELKQGRVQHSGLNAGAVVGGVGIVDSAGSAAGGGGRPPTFSEMAAMGNKGKGALLRRSLAKRLESVPDAPVCMEESELEPAREIAYEELVESTRNWSDELQLGEGGSAIVYKGFGTDGQLWAVKRGKKGGLTRLKDFRKEIDAVSKMSHPNLVRLLGYCEEGEEQVLVYEYVANGTLRQHLTPLQGQTEQVLSFERRLDVAVGVAEGLYYLHSCKPMLVHRDVKSLNVFMDSDMQPKLGDFGNLKHIGDEASSPTHTRVVGTPGYLDPQYCQTSVVSDRADVYSFGVVLLELITGKPPVLKEADDSGERMALAKWATPAICSGNVDSVVDPSLQQCFLPQSMQALASLAAMCVQRQPKDRPAMGEVVRRLKTVRQQALSAAAALQQQQHQQRLQPAPSVQRPLPPKPGRQGSWRDSGGVHITPPMSPLLPTTPEGATPSPRFSGSSGSGSGGGGMKVFHKEFWRPRRAPTRSLSDASMAEMTEYLEDEASSVASGGAYDGGGGGGDVMLSPHYAPSLGMMSSGGSFQERGFHDGTQRQSRFSGGGQAQVDRQQQQQQQGLQHNHTYQQAPMSPLLSPQTIPKSKSADVPGANQNRQGGAIPQSPSTSSLAAVSPSPLVEPGGRRIYSLGRKNKMQKEMALLAKLQHTNLAAILGYAAEKEDMQIAYDLPPNCTCLENYLFPEDAEGEFLPLRVRLKVAVGVAKGLTFLHANSVIHGNLLSRNIMLDKNFTVLLTGYGLAPLLAKNANRKGFRGLDGMAKDAFDYGVVLFELLTGRRGAHVAERGGADAVTDWAEPFIEEYEASAGCVEPAKRMVVRMLDVLARECVQDDPRCRPSLKDLVVRLYGLQESLASQ
uniref:Receptor-like kinase n=1 Tax=Closterium ehrenbergii TaxID=102165 RepID=A7VM50_CLOEH|nr:receptor-like kinase [Closterium ehrenbergii]